MSRSADIISIFPPSAVRTGAATTTFVYPVPYDILVRSVTVTGINPGSTDGDTLRVIVDSSAVGAASFTTIADTTADEYNDTDDTAALGTGSTNKTRSVGASDWGTLTFPGTRVAAGRYLRIREIWAGTVGDGQVQIGVHFTRLSDALTAT